MWWGLIVSLVFLAPIVEAVEEWRAFIVARKETSSK